MTKQHTPNYAGIKPIKTNGHALSNTTGHCGPYGKTLTKGGVNNFTGPQPQIGVSPTIGIRANQKPMAGSQTSSKGGHK